VNSDSEKRAVGIRNSPIVALLRKVFFEVLQRDRSGQYFCAIRDLFIAEGEDNDSRWRRGALLGRIRRGRPGGEGCGPLGPPATAPAPRGPGTGGAARYPGLRGPVRPPEGGQV